MTANAKHDDRTATGKDIPAPPAKAAEAAKPDTEAFTFTPAGADTETAAVEPVPGAVPEAVEVQDGLPVTWSDEQVALGRRISVSRGGEGEPVTCFEEVLPSNATQKQVDEATQRLRQRLTAE